MIFIVPIVLGAIALATGGAGVAAGVNGAFKFQEAEKIGKKAEKKYKNKVEAIEKFIAETDNLAQDYGKLILDINLHTVKRFIAFIERIGQKANHKDIKALHELAGLSLQDVGNYKKAVLEAEHLAKNVFKAVGAAYAANQGILAAVGVLGTASTGAAIGGLSGAAAWNATLAWLGGGSLAVGGGGMALGTLVLGGITIGPSLLIGGFVLGGKGEEALTDAVEYAAKVESEIANMDTYGRFLGQVQRRILELTTVVNALNKRALSVLDELESREFIIERDVIKFQKCALLVKALVEISKISIVTGDDINPDLDGLIDSSYKLL